MAQNPGIPNPEVSKIIGEQWRRLSATAKEEWNSLAEVCERRRVPHNALCANSPIIRKRKPATNSNIQAIAIIHAATVEPAPSPPCQVPPRRNHKSLAPSVEGGP